MSRAATPGRYRLERARDADIDAVMSWFGTEHDVLSWGGPKFRYPFTAETFRKDCHFPQMNSFGLFDDDGALLAFGQLYDRNGRINLARLVVRPERRGEGLGQRLVEELMAIGPTLLPLTQFSLFVNRDNTPALRCYQALGFEIDDYPEDQILADQCYFLIRPVDGRGENDAVPDEKARSK